MLLSLQPRQTLVHVIQVFILRPQTICARLAPQTVQLVLMVLRVYVTHVLQLIPFLMELALAWPAKLITTINVLRWLHVRVAILTKVIIFAQLDLRTVLL